MHKTMGLLVAGLAVTGAHAQDRTAATRTVEAITDCRALTADAARLACYDKAAASLVAAKEKGELIVLDREKVVERRRQRFGLAMDSDPGINTAEIKQIDTTIQSVANAKVRGKYDLALANGSVWQTIDPVFLPKAGDPIRIAVASLGGFRAKIDGGRAILVKRIR